MSNDTVQEIEKNIKLAKKLVDLGNAVERLRQNRDFKAVVLDGYLAQEAIRLVHLKSAPEFQTPERQSSILSQIDAIGGFTQYLNTVVQQGAAASKSIAADEEAVAEILAEENGND